jgi:hypothetical protein
MQRKYQEIEDQSAVAFADKNRLPFVVTYFGACVSVVAFIAVIYFVGIPK